ncbi:hypothetical protein FDO65_10190 [Nakamurella flava]|uniref:Uncharacterized protein n=1 Tax=Nakamurella flava TaxID=2576308 RepID=A0A4U6QMM0_9ACTN|nr:hypothetical protein [Nakamurella flava]TKV61884.1 hypothetical protein FDO65_10190 [Nakamurella flava]
MRVRRLKQVTVRGGLDWAGDVVDATFTADGGRVDLVAGDGQARSLELAGPPIDVRWGYVLRVVGAEATVHLVQCADCAERKEIAGG